MKEIKYITVLDFEVGEVFQYEVLSMQHHHQHEKYLTEQGHNLGNCEWMVHNSNKIITK